MGLVVIKEDGRDMGVWQGVAMDSLKFHLVLLCPWVGHP
jgi:hypothetical protein